MKDQERPSLASELFRLGGLNAKLLYWAEYAWLDDDTDDSTALARVGSSVKAIARLVDSLDAEACGALTTNALERLPTAAEAFYRVFQRAWLDDDRRRDMRGIYDAVEPEAVFDFQEALIEKSPLQDKSWKDWTSTHDKLREALDSGLCACFELGQMLERERHPTITDGVRALDETARQAYFAVEFNSDLAEQMAILTEDFLYLRELDHDLSDCAGPAISQVINRLRRGIAAGLANPPLLPGYLGLLLDEQHCSVRRLGRRKKLDLSGPLIWGVLKGLERGGPDLVSRATLNRILDARRRAGGRGSRTTTAINADSPLDQHLRLLRAALRELGVDIEGERGLGWRLVEFHKGRPRRRKQKSAPRTSSTVSR